jgi:tetratricopeptide (TPR) repeat protein
MLELTQLGALMNTGRFAELEMRTREYLSLQPDSGIVWQILGTALSAQGKDAVQALSRAVQLLPNEAAAHNNLGNAFARQGRLTEAVASYRRALNLCPELPQGYNNLAHALLDLRQFDAAAVSSRRAIALNPRDAEAHSHLGCAVQGLGRPDQALECYRCAIAIEPDFAEAHNNLGNALMEVGRTAEALDSYRRALKINPAFAEAHNNLGNAFRSLENLKEAVASYDRALRINPRFAEAHCNRGIALRLQGHTALAQSSCRKALEIDGRSAAAIIGLAESSADIGDFLEAEALFKRAISVESESPEAWAGLVRLRKMTKADAPWLAQAQRIADKGLVPRQKIVLHYAIGKYFEDVGNFDQAFAHFRHANDMTKLLRTSHDRQGLTRTVDFITRTYDAKWLSESRLGTIDSALQPAGPVFIVGMLRSGTTLAEQILAAHPAVFGAGELNFWSAAFESYRTSECAQTVQGLASLATDYLRLLREVSHDAPRVVDKMPTNFAFLGWIHAALPNARIIHMQRNPLDTCLSIYSQHFESTVSYANDLEDLAHYYLEYRRLMHHWRLTLPENVVLDVPYEGLVADQESWSRKMLQFIGVPWDSRCLDFHHFKRTVITASKWQVRQKISSSSVGRWRNFEKFVSPLLQLMEQDSTAGAA